jgi:glyoxylase I family protein
MPSIAGVHHFSLTVTDLAKSVSWYGELFGLSPMLDETHAGGRAVVLFDPERHVYVGLHGHERNDGTAFDETRTGLDHVSFAVRDRAELVEWQERLATYGVPQSPIADLDYGSILVFRDPDNIQLELAAPPTA